MKRAKITGFAALSLIIAALGLYLWGSRARTPLRVVFVKSSNGQLRVFPALMGAVILLPDGSLWLWGELPDSRMAISPEQMGAQHRWSTVEVSLGTCLGLDDGRRLWQFPAISSGPPVQIDPGHDWIGVRGCHFSQHGNSHGYWLGFRTDGTLCAWADRTTDAPTNLFKVGANALWRAVSIRDKEMAALRGDGTLWRWNMAAGPRSNELTFSTPKQVGSASNWARFENALGWTTDGEAYLIFAPAPARIGNHGFSLTPGRFAWGAQGRYELRNDGSLWHLAPPTEGAQISSSQAERVGTRSDWISICSANQTIFGLTSDGTLWTWGQNWSLDFTPTIWKRLARKTAPYLEKVGMKIPSSSNESKEPWPLMRLVPSNSPP